MSEVIQFGPGAYREFSLDKPCQENQGHLHHYDHWTIVMTGAVKVFYTPPGRAEEAESAEFVAGTKNCMFLVKKDVRHRIKATRPGTTYRCLFTHRDHEGMVVQEYEGHLEAYDLKEAAHV